MSPAPSTPQHPATATADSTHPPIRHRTHTSITHTRGKESAMNISSETSSITPPLHSNNSDEEIATFTPLLPKQRKENNYSILNTYNSNPTISKTSTLNKEQENYEVRNLQKYHKCFHPFMDTSGSATSILKGLSYLTLLGIVVGVLMPKNNDLPTPSYRYLSSIVGYTYFIFWCSSFYPQILSNYERKSTEGLSVDFSIINFLGYICYSSYTSLLYWNRDIQQLYQERHSTLIENGDGDGQATQNVAKITVQSNDVAFALHAVLFSAIWIYQLFLYGGLKWHGGKFPLSRIFVVFVCLIVASISLYVYLILNFDTSKPSRSKWAMEHLNWLDFLYFLSYIKVAITLSKYIPQVVLNAR